jgi:alkylhydroperoxidase family enzyme
MNGAPLNVHRLMAHSPDLLQAWWDFRNYSVNGGSLGQHLAELVILRVGVHLGAWYEWASHVDRAVRIGIEPRTISEVLNSNPDLPRKEALVLKTVDELMADHRIQGSTRVELEDHFETAQLMDLIAIQGMYVILGGFIHTWGLDLDDAVASRVATHTNQAEFEAAAAAFRQTAVSTQIP